MPRVGTVSAFWSAAISICPEPLPSIGAFDPTGWVAAVFRCCPSGYLKVAGAPVVADSGSPSDTAAAVLEAVDR